MSDAKSGGKSKRRKSAAKAVEAPASKKLKSGKKKARAAAEAAKTIKTCLLYTSPSPRD